MPLEEIVSRATLAARYATAANFISRTLRQLLIPGLQSGLSMCTPIAQPLPQAPQTMLCLD